MTILESAVRVANETYFVVFDNTRTSTEIVWFVSFVFVLVFFNENCSKEYKNVVELKRVEPKDLDTKRKGGIVNDGEKKIDPLDQATSWHIEVLEQTRPQPSNPFPALTSLIVLFH